MHSCEAFCNHLSARILEDAHFRSEIGVAFQVRISDLPEAIWFFDCKGESPTARRGSGPYEVEITCSKQNFELLMTGALNPQRAWVEKAIALRGVLEQALPLFRIFCASSTGASITKATL